jgi:hypothetical protein
MISEARGRPCCPQAGRPVEARYSDEVSPDLPRRLRGLPTRQLVAEDGPYPTVKVERTAPRLPGRPPQPCHQRAFTPVSTGPERTPTDNAMAASTCAVPYPRS